jgi:hypothetical protein
MLTVQVREMSKLASSGNPYSRFLILALGA